MTLEQLKARIIELTKSDDKWAYEIAYRGEILPELRKLSNAELADLYAELVEELRR